MEAQKLGVLNTLKTLYKDEEELQGWMQVRGWRAAQGTRVLGLGAAQAGQPPSPGWPGSMLGAQACCPQLQPCVGWPPQCK